MSEEIELKCPICGEKINDRGNFYGCAGYPNCNFTVSKEIAEVEIDKELLTVLVEKGETKELEGFVSKTGNDFKAKLVVNEEKEQVDFKFVNNDEELKIDCPVCKKEAKNENRETIGKIVDKGKFYGCSNYSNKEETCMFSIGKEIAGVEISKEDLKSLSDKEETEVKEFDGKNGEFEAKVIVGETNEVGFEFV